MDRHGDGHNDSDVALHIYVGGGEGEGGSGDGDSDSDSDGSGGGNVDGDSHSNGDRVLQSKSDLYILVLDIVNEVSDRFQSFYLLTPTKCCAVTLSNTK